MRTERKVEFLALASAAIFALALHWTPLHLASEPHDVESHHGHHHHDDDESENRHPAADHQLRPAFVHAQPQIDLEVIDLEVLEGPDVELGPRFVLTLTDPPATLSRGSPSAPRSPPIV
jgi:hypothetical protein